MLRPLPQLDMMHGTCRIGALAALLVLPLFSGCFYSREIARTQRAIEKENPQVDFRRQVMFSMGSGSLGTLAELASFGQPAEVREASDYLRHIRRVKVGVFEIEGDLEGPLAMTHVPHFTRGGWQTVVRVREPDGENVSVLYRERYGEVRDLFVVALDAPELVIVRLTGNLTQLLLDALDDYGDEIDAAFDWFEED